MGKKNFKRIFHTRKQFPSNRIIALEYFLFCSLSLFVSHQLVHFKVTPKSRRFVLQTTFPPEPFQFHPTTGMRQLVAFCRCQTQQTNKVAKSYGILHRFSTHTQTRIKRRFVAQLSIGGNDGMNGEKCARMIRIPRHAKVLSFYCSGCLLTREINRWNASQTEERFEN